jgi:probable rRNA maturation factor
MRKTADQAVIRFHYLQPARFPVRALKHAIFQVFTRNRKTLGSLNYVFCSDEDLIEMNRSFLNHDYFTDIITFDLSESGKAIVGDIFISAERVRENAAKFGVPIYQELMRVGLHGALHLVGFGDKTDAERRLMRKEEDRYLVIALESVPRETKEKKRFHVKHRRGVP